MTEEDEALQREFTIEECLQFLVCSLKKRDKALTEVRFWENKIVQLEERKK